MCNCKFFSFNIATRKCSFQIRIYFTFNKKGKFRKNNSNICYKLVLQPIRMSILCNFYFLFFNSVQREIVVLKRVLRGSHCMSTFRLPQVENIEAPIIVCRICCMCDIHMYSMYVMYTFLDIK